jgi:heptosyltransferase-2
MKECLSVARPNRILVRGVNWLGDAVMTTPALLRLREAFPAAHLTLLTPEKLAGLWPGFPLDRVVVSSPQCPSWRVALQLRRERFDLAVVLPNSPRSALEVWLTGARRRVGYAGQWRRWFLTQPVPPRPGHREMRKRSAFEVRRLIACRTEAVAGEQAGASAGESGHHVYHYLHLVGAVGAEAKATPPRLFVGEAEVVAVAQVFGLGHDHAEGVPLLGLNPGAEYGPAKRWPIERLAEVAAEVQRRTGCRCVVLGGASDQELAAQLVAAIACALAQSPGAPNRPAQKAVLNLAGRTGLRELCAVAKACTVVLTNDTGPMHVAAAVGTPVVALFGSTDPALTGPGLPGQAAHRVFCCGAPCAPCFRRVCPLDGRCLTNIKSQEVVEAVMCLLAQARRR